MILPAVASAPTPPRLLDTISVGEVVVFVVLLGAFVQGLRKVWPIVRRLSVLAEAAEWLPEVRRQLDVIHHEVTPNGGGSIKDAVRRLEERQVSQGEQLDDANEQIQNVSRRLDRHIDRDR